MPSVENSSKIMQSIELVILLKVTYKDHVWLLVSPNRKNHNYDVHDYFFIQFLLNYKFLNHGNQP